METLARIKPLSILAAGLLIGGLAGFFLSRILEEQPPREGQVRQFGFRFIRPLLECEPDHRELGYFKESLKKTVEALEDGRLVRTVAVYFRDLDNGPWMGVKEERPFSPASLFKVPLIMACFKQSEIIPGWLDFRLKYQGLPDEALGNYHYPPAATLQVGHEYAVMDLINRVAMYSDNGATWTLQEAVDGSVLARVYSDLGLDPAHSLYGSTPTVTAETYGRFFRVLYNATYLGRTQSEAALEAFSRSTFRKGLVAGVPDGTVVSHKFGEKMKEEGGERITQLHDVGIVYHPQKPYLLCVLTIGTDYEAQAAAISTVSRFIWEQVNQQVEVFVSP